MDHYANSHPDIRFIVAPHEISEDRLAGVERLFRHCVRYSVWAAGAAVRPGAGSRPVAGMVRPVAGMVRPGWPEPNVLLIDNIGMLSRLYRYASIAYVGGGFGDDGVHNVLEAAVYGKPVVFGPVIEKYIEAVELTESGGGIVIDSALEAEKVFDRLLRDEQESKEAGAASREYVHSKKGATGKIIRYITMQKMLEK
jgi:3-deoxy-D-manno-octulosonic-acid transferase